jgi:hypothetical protein
MKSTALKHLLSRERGTTFTLTFQPDEYPSLRRMGMNDRMRQHCGVPRRALDRLGRTEYCKTSRGDSGENNVLALYAAEGDAAYNAHREYHDGPTARYRRGHPALGLCLRHGPDLENSRG